MDLDAKRINKICKKNSENAQDFQELRAKLIAELIINERYDDNNEDISTVNVMVEEATESFPNLNPCERALLTLTVKMFWLGRYVSNTKKK
jgi:hypothetical protein